MQKQKPNLHLSRTKQWNSFVFVCDMSVWNCFLFSSKWSMFLNMTLITPSSSLLLLYHFCAISKIILKYIKNNIKIRNTFYLINFQQNINKIRTMFYLINLQQKVIFGSLWGKNTASASKLSSWYRI